MATVAVVGLGAMGRAFAARLLGSGHEVVVWNRSPGPVDVLVAEGATTSSSPADAARRADFVIIMVADAAALRAVTEGPDGVLAGARPGSTVLQMATVGPAALHQLAERVPEDVKLVDCPVLGSISEAEAGTLSVFVGGDHGVAEHVLSSLGRVVPVGPLGAGSAAKLVANSTLLGVMAVLGEAIALGDGLGLPRQATFEVLAASPLAAQAERRRGPLESGDFPLRFALALARKDAGLVADAAAGAGVPMPVASAAQGWFADADESGRGADDYSTVLAHIAAQARS